MFRFNNVMEVFKLLNKSNCRECFQPTCLAFAGAVFKGEKELEECPYLPSEIIAQIKDTRPVDHKVEQGGGSEMLDEFKTALLNIDFELKAASIGGTFSDGKLTLKVMGKNVSVDNQGKIFTDIHVNQWLVMPLFNYIVEMAENSRVNTLESANNLVAADWVPFRELPNGRAWQGLFEKQCESLIKKVADTYPLFFEQILELFNGKEVEKHYKSDISLVLHPFPKVPILICYWLPEDEIESDLHLFFDAETENILNINSIYALGAGLARMFEKLAIKHGF